MYSCKKNRWCNDLNVNYQRAKCKNVNVRTRIMHEMTVDIQSVVKTPNCIPQYNMYG